ncbi:MAG TPA: hypothetical protein VI548_10255 [Chitinophagaceae bacterium]|nr:hypothetical protein [Chitinophagaceae bacterium]
MKNILSLFIFLSLFINSCKEKKESEKEPVISVLSIIKGQVNHIDTSFYQLVKTETVDGKTDTTYIKREEVRGLAAAFLSLPDISQNHYSENYTEDRLIDASQNTLSITSTAKEEKPEIQKQIIIIPLDELASGKVESIFIDRSVRVNDSSIQQKLFWQIDQYFQVVSIIQKGNEPEKVQITKVKWD